MRVVLILLCLAASPLRAEAPVVEDCAVNPDRACPVEVLLPGLELVQANPVAVADRLTLLAVDEAAATVAVDLSLDDEAVKRILPLKLGETDYQVVSGLIADNGQGYALNIWQGDTNAGLLFVRADGTAAALMQANRPDDWPLEMSLAEAMMLLGTQHVLTFDGAALEGKVYRFGLRATASDGQLVVAELEPGTGQGDTLGAYLDRRLAGQIDPVGSESVTFEGPLSAVTTTASDGSPSRLLLRSEEGGEIAFDQRLGPERMRYDYQAARVSADGRYLAAIRTEADPGKAPQLLVFDATTSALIFEAPLPSGSGPQLLWLDGGRVAVVQTLEGEGVQVLVLKLSV